MSTLDGKSWFRNNIIPYLTKIKVELADIPNTIIATAVEVDEGASVDKVASVNQLALKYAKLNGNSSELFSVAAGNIDTNEALNASQFSSTSITNAEVNSDWASA